MMLALRIFFASYIVNLSKSFRFITSKSSSRSTLYARVEDVKQQLLTTIDGDTSSLFVCPETLSDLKRIHRDYGLVEETYYVDSKYQKKYRAYKNRLTIIDLTIKDDNEFSPFRTQSFNELIGQGFFQNPFISTVYERGYRDNFRSRF
jgi:hypothetical protein